MAGCGNTSENYPNYQHRQYQSLSSISSELKSFECRNIVGAKVGVPGHVLARRSRKLDRHQQRRAAQLAYAIGKYRPQLRAEATSAAVGASTPLHAYRPAQANRATCCPPRTSDGGIRNRDASIYPNTSKHVSSVSSSRDDKLPEGLSADVDMEWVSMVTVTIPRFYRLYLAVPRLLPEKREGITANGGISALPDQGSDNGAQGSDNSHDIRRVLTDIRQHLSQNPARDISQRLLASSPYTRCVAAASRPFTLQTIYTGVADKNLESVSGRAAVLIGVHGALAMAERMVEEPRRSKNSPTGADNNSRSSSMVPCRSEREAHLRSAMVLADALLQHRGAGTLTLPELRCLVTIIAQLQPSVVLLLTGAAATARAAAATSLELLVALARTLASCPMSGLAEFENKHWELCRFLLLQHQAGIQAAMDEAEDLHTQRPLRFINLYARGFSASIMKDAHPLFPQSVRPGPAPGLVCTASSGFGSPRDGCHGTLEGARVTPHLIVRHMTKLLLQCCGAKGGRGAPLRLTSAMHEEERMELARMLLAAALDGCRHSLVAVGGSTMKTVLTNIAALGYFRENSAKLVAAFSDTAALAAGATEKVGDGLRQGPLADDNSSRESIAALSPDINGAAYNGHKRATSCGSVTSNDSSNNNSNWHSAASNGSSNNNNNWRSGSSNGSSTSSAGGISCASGSSPSGILCEGLLGVRLMTSAQLVMKHCPEAAGILAERSETTMETGASHSGDQPAGLSEGQQKQQQQKLDPFWLPEGVPSVAAVTLLPLPAALSHHIALASTPPNNRVISARVRGDTKEQHGADVSGLAQWLRRHHALSMMALTDGGIEHMVLLAAQVSLELLREGIDVVMVPELYQQLEQKHLKDIQDFIGMSIIDHPHLGVRVMSCDSGLHQRSTATGTADVGRCAIVQAAAGPSSPHDNLQEDQCARLNPNWQSQRRIALNGVMSTLLDLRGSSLNHVKFVDHDMSEQHIGAESESAEETARKVPTSVWNGLRDAVEKRRCWLCGSSRPVWLKLTLMAFEIGHGGELGKPLPLQVDSPFKHFRDWRDILVGAGASVR
ncbi:hypothetical protein Vafri_7557 [Volvox africanus]|uniref:Uncharacterized protein n=1 Tax=Volvox africanus TaxID=51714 RepID=A0A8J4B0I8_9CHLO|nr:hypothetical protein Vafri_7557 [Volvox africanus]